MKKYIFDVDGTLTPSRQKIDSNFADFFLRFISNRYVYLVTGSNRKKTIEQITEPIYNECKRVYNCSGNDVYEGAKVIYRSDWKIPNELREFLLDELDFSTFPVRCGCHIEERPGGINFSILGRRKVIDLRERQDYVEWDLRTNERKDIAERLKDNFPNISVQIGGETGLDITPLGKDKSQILKDFKNEDEIYFYGDMMEKGQNDYLLAEAVLKRKGSIYSVKDYKETWDLLEQYEL